MSENETVDFERAAALLGISRATLPDHVMNEGGPECGPTGRIITCPLTDEEWAVIRPYVPPLPVPKPDDFDDRGFVGAACFFAAARARGYGWSLLPEALYGRRSSREKRWARWVMAGTWERLFAAVADDSSLSPSRLDALRWLAQDARRRRERILASRERLTNRL